MTDKRIRYTRVKPHQQTRKNVVLEAASLYASPVLGSRLVFPRLFNRAAESLLRGRRSAAIPVSLARWYFGEKLLIHVDPARLTRRISDFVREPKGPRWVGSYFLDSADWSRALSQIASTPVHKEMSQIVEAGLDYRATEAFAALNRIASEGRPTQRNGVVLKGRDEIEAYFRYCVGLITSVRRARDCAPAVRQLQQSRRCRRSPRSFDGARLDRARRRRRHQCRWRVDPASGRQASHRDRPGASPPKHAGGSADGARELASAPGEAERNAGPRSLGLGSRSPEDGGGDCRRTNWR